MRLTWIHYVSIRIIKESFLKTCAEAHPRAADAIKLWITLVRAAQWTTPVEMKRTFRDVDPAKVGSSHTVYVFNIRRNEFRLIAAIHFDRQRVYVLRFMTHAEYDRQKWKEEL